MGGMCTQHRSLTCAGHNLARWQLTLTVLLAQAVVFINCATIYYYTMTNCVLKTT